MPVRFTLNRAGVAALLKSPEVKANLKGRAQRVAATAGPGNEITDATTNRARYVVITATAEAMVTETKSRNLTRAIDAARG